MNAQELFIKANQALDNVIGQVEEEQMELTLPDDVSWRPNQTLRQAMNILAYENQCVPEVLAGKDDLETNVEFSGDLLGDDPQGNYRRYSDIANQAAAALRPGPYRPHFVR